MNVLFTFFSIVLISFLFSEFTKKLKISSIVSLILFGMFLGIPFLNLIYLGNEEFISLLGDIGLFALMFLAGLESSWKTIKKEEKESLFIASFGVLVPFSISFLILYFVGLEIFTSLIIAVCLSITAEATKAQFLMEINKVKSKLGSAMLGAGIIDDIFGLILFSIIMFFMGISEYKEYILLFGALFAFFLGIFIQKFARHHHLTKKTENLFEIFLVPFFFVSVGIHFHFSSILDFDYLTLLIIIFGFTLKILGVMLSKFFLKFSYKQLYFIGWGMNSRGGIELALILMAFKLNIINKEIYSSVIFMSLLTTIVFPIIGNKIFKKNPKILD